MQRQVPNKSTTIGSSLKKATFIKTNEQLTATTSNAPSVEMAPTNSTSASGISERRPIVYEGRKEPPPVLWLEHVDKSIDQVGLNLFAAWVEC